MRGHEPLIAMRKAGALPSTVAFVTDLPARLGAIPTWLQWQNQDHLQSLIPSIDIDSGDSVSRLDFRFLVGMTVHVTGWDSDRLDALVTALERVNPARLISTLHSPEDNAILRMTDSAGVLTHLFEDEQWHA